MSSRGAWGSVDDDASGESLVCLRDRLGTEGEV